MRTVKQRWKTLAFAAIVVAGLGCSVDANAAASKKNITCLKTNTGNYFPVVRVSMLVVPDGSKTFEIVLKDGEGEAGVQSVTCEKHEVEIDLSQYQGDPYADKSIDMTKPIFMLLSNGKYYKMKELPEMSVQEGSDKIDVKVGLTTEKGVSAVYFYRGDEDGITGIDAPMTATAQEKLQLMTPIREQMTISGCGDAPRAQVFSLDGKLMTEAAVSNGVTTIQVGHLNAGVYVVRVGNKALKFTKK
jgi:hypothetical protein